MPYKEFCLNRYNELFNQHYPVFLNRRTGQTAQKQAEQAAQRIAIKDTLKEALDRYSPEIETADLWKAIYVAHLKRKSGLTTLDTIDEQIIGKKPVVMPLKHLFLKWRIHYWNNIAFVSRFKQMYIK